MSSNIAVKILANAGALWAAARYIPGFHVTPVEFFQFALFPVDASLQTFLIAGIAFALASIVLYPLASVIAALLPLITTAMLMVAIHMALLYAAAALSTALSIAGLEPLFWGGLLLGIINTLL